jgi:hypothetical protein
MPRMSRFHQLWIVDAELEIRNPAPDEAQSCGARIFEALEAYASEESAPYPAQVVRDDDRWAEVTFPVWAPSRFAALAAGATVLAEVCGRAEIETTVVRLAVGESAAELHCYRSRMHVQEERSDTERQDVAS